MALRNYQVLPLCFIDTAFPRLFLRFFFKPAQLMSFGIKRNLSLGQCLENFWKIYFVSLVVAKIIRRLRFGPIYINLILTVIVAYGPILQYSRVNFI